MKSIFKIFILSCLLLACSPNSADVQKIRVEHLLHDESSKMWMIDSDITKGEEYASENINFRTVIVFYKDGTFSEQPLNTLGNRPPTNGTYEVINNNNLIHFKLSSSDNYFEIERADAVEVILRSQESVLKLVPLPKL